jgi:disulfide bond formation protein DsbB
MPAVTLERASLYFATLVAWVATLGSLYFSEVLGYVPCTWCWYQRIIMYPLALLIPLGLLRRDNHLPFYSAIFAALGMGASTYHYLLQKTDWFTSGICMSGVPCNIDYINWLGFITIPFLALMAFTLIFFSSVIALTARRPVWDEETMTPWLPVAGTIALALLTFAPGFLG